MRISTLSIIALVLFGSRPLGAASIIEHGEPYQPNLDKQVPGVLWHEIDAFHYLKYVAAQGVCIGAEMQDFKSLQFKLSSSTQSVRNFLDDFIRQAPGYRWEEHDGIIRVAPISSVVGKRSIPALDGVLKKFASAGMGVTWTSTRLQAMAYDAGLPVASAKLSTTAWRMIEDREWSDARITLEFSAPVRIDYVLDSIVKADPPSVWIATEAADGKMTILAASVHKHRGLSAYSARIREQNIDLNELPERR